MGEIGSEFHRMPLDQGLGLNLPGNGAFVFSGRTAIETVLKQVPGARKAILPSYCCESMIQPFRDAGIEVVFYPVNYRNGLKVEVDISVETDILLLCNYFGYRQSYPDLSQYKGVIIEDVTHSLLSKVDYHSQSHYLVASIRKWEPIICGGYCAAINGKLDYVPEDNPPMNYIELKTSAMKLKTEYLFDLDAEKKIKYLSAFENSNRWLAANYSALSIDTWSRGYLATVDVEKQRRKRRNNAKVLYEGLKGKLEFLFPEENMDCPLFVPILLPNRDEVRRILIENQIYCPIHWPKPKGCESNLYELELSLVCDQRYNAYDMERIVCILNKMI